MAARYTKPKGMKYTDLCIYIDNNIYKPNCDIKVYTPELTVVISRDNSFMVLLSF